MFGFAPVKIEDIADYSNGRIDFSELDSDNYVGVDNLLQDKLGKNESTCIPKSGKYTKYNCGDILIGNIRPYLKKIWLSDRVGGTNGDVLAIHPNVKYISSKFLYYILSADKFFDYDMKFAKGAKMPRGDKSAVMNYTFMLPTLEEQERIVEILDKFNVLCNDLSNGLPAEIEKRQKQYEYYRDKLLTFKKMN